MPWSSMRAPARSSVVRIVVAWRANASCAICRTRTCSRESFVGRRKSYVRGSPRRERPTEAAEVAGGTEGGAAAAGASAGGSGDASADCGPASGASGPVSGWVTLSLIGGQRADPDRRRPGAAGQREGCDGWCGRDDVLPLLRHVLVVVDVHDLAVVGLDDLLLEGLLERVAGAGDVGRVGLRARRDDQVLGLGAVQAALVRGAALLGELEGDADLEVAAAGQ